MSRPARDLTAAQVREVRTLAEARGMPLCSDPGCANPPASDGASDAATAGLCSLHRQKQRNAEGACPNCGTGMALVPIINDLTGRPRTTGTTHERRCPGCGYTAKQRPARGR